MRLPPTHLVDVVHSTPDLLLDGESGLGICQPRRRDMRRVGFSVLGSERGQLLPALDDALARCLRHR
jgi:hypothetical protein